MTNRGSNRGLSGTLRYSVILSLFFLLTAAGCKTSDDATAAATQMTATAKALAGYYATLQDEVQRTSQLQSVLEATLSEQHDDAGTKAIADAEASIGLRKDLADSLSELAAAFTSLASSDSAKNASASATALQGELESIKKLDAASPVIDAFASAMQPLVKAIQEHKEREAARAMAAVVPALEALFKQETALYESLDSTYIRTARRSALNLARNGQIDESAVFKDALDPFGMTPNVTSPILKAQTDLLAQRQIESKTTDHIAAFKDATNAMDDALAEMGRRIDLVAHDSPMPSRGPPQSLARVHKATRAAE